MKTFNDFYPDVVTEVPGCPAEMVDLALRNTIIEFCEKSTIHQATLDPLTLLEGIGEYDLDAPDGYRVHRVMQAWFKGQPLTPVGGDMVAHPESYADFIGGYTAPKAPPREYTQRDASTLTFLPIPDQRYVNAVTIRVALVPLRNFTQVEDFLYEEWCEPIAAGAKARLMLNPGKPYTNVEAASVNQARYIAGRNDALQKARRGLVRSELRVKLRNV